jgi:hypothetical protein
VQCETGSKILTVMLLTMKRPCPGVSDFDAPRMLSKLYRTEPTTMDAVPS